MLFRSEVTDDLLSTAPMIESADGAAVSLVDCPHCHARIELEFEPDPAETGGPTR